MSAMTHSDTTLRLMCVESHLLIQVQSVWTGREKVLKWNIWKTCVRNNPRCLRMVIRKIRRYSQVNEEKNKRQDESGSSQQVEMTVTEWELWKTLGQVWCFWLYSKGGSSHQGAVFLIRCMFLTHENPHRHKENMKISLQTWFELFSLIFWLCCTFVDYCCSPVGSSSSLYATKNYVIKTHQ